MFSSVLETIYYLFPPVIIGVINSLRKCRIFNVSNIEQLPNKWHKISCILPGIQLATIIWHFLFWLHHFFANLFLPCNSVSMRGDWENTERYYRFSWKKILLLGILLKAVLNLCFCLVDKRQMGVIWLALGWQHTYTCCSERRLKLWEQIWHMPLFSSFLVVFSWF